MRNVISIIILLSLIVSLPALSGCGGSGTNVAILTVVVSSDRGVEQDATVTLTPTSRQGTTNQLGIVIFSDLAIRSYEINATKEVEGHNLSAVANVDMSSGLARTVNMTIEE